MCEDLPRLVPGRVLSANQFILSYYAVEQPLCDVMLLLSPFEGGSAKWLHRLWRRALPNEQPAPPCQQACCCCLREEAELPVVITWQRGRSCACASGRRAGARPNGRARRVRAYRITGTGTVVHVHVPVFIYMYFDASISRIVSYILHVASMRWRAKAYYR